MIAVRKNDGYLSFVEADQIVRISATRPKETANLAELPVTTVFILKDGSRLEGKFIRRDSTMITVRKSNNQLTYFEPELLVRVDTLREGPTGQFAATDRVYANQFSPWLLTGQTAFTPEKGQVYYRNTLVALNEISYGITRNWSVGATFLTPGTYVYLPDFYAVNGFLPTYSQLFSTLRLPIGDRFRFAVNVTYLDRYALSSKRRGALTYKALATIGTSQRNVTLGAGLINRGNIRYYYGQPIYSSSMPSYFDVNIPDQVFFTLGIMQKISPLLSLISDTQINLGTNNFYYDDHSEWSSFSFALRLDRSRHAFDLGLYSLLYGHNNAYNGQRFRFLPYLGYNVRFGKK
ncbi:hypothetical protein GCM10027085_27820 [Spirosoma aerophilum]